MNKLMCGVLIWLIVMTCFLIYQGEVSRGNRKLIKAIINKMEELHGARK